jgi:hypothetical protein
MPAPMKIYRVVVRVVPFHAPAFNVKVEDVSASNAHDARMIAERRVAPSYPDARAIVGVDQRRVRIA